MKKGKKKKAPRCAGCRKLQGRVQRLEQENAKLRAALEEARRAGKRQAAPFSKGPPKKNPKKPGRKPGELYGERAGRPRPQHIDEDIDVPCPKTCPDCQGEVEEEGIEEQFQTDIPKVRPHTTRFGIHYGRCKCCRRRVQGRHPRQTSDALGAASVGIGPNAMALAAQLNKVVGASYEKIAVFFEAAFELEVSRSTICRGVLRVAKKAEGFYAEVAVEVNQSPVVYPDETGWKVGGRSQWLWVFVSLANRATFYIIQASRGADVAEIVLGDDYDGVLGHDGWKPYDRFQNAQHQQCLNHLLNRSNRVIEVVPAKAVHFPEELKQIFQAGLDLRDRRDEGTISPHGLAVATGRLKNRVDAALALPPGHPENQRLHKHIDSHREDLFTFLDHPDVEATNWPAEQAIRPAVVNRKMSGGNRTQRGAEAQAILSTFFRTCSQRGLDSVPLLVDLQRSRDPEEFATTALGP